MIERFDRAEAMVNEMLSHARAAATAASSLKPLSATEEWEEQAEKTCRKISRIHEDVVECMRAFAAFSKECGRPLEREHGRERNRLTSRDGDAQRVQVAMEMILPALKRARIAVTQGGHIQFSGEGTPEEYSAALSFMNGGEARERLQQTMEDEKISEKISDIALIEKYFLSRTGVGQDKSADLFPRISKKFLSQGREV